MELVEFLGYLGFSISLTFTASTIPGIIKNGKNGEFEKIPIHFMLLNVVTQGLWVIYSIMI